MIPHSHIPYGADGAGFYSDNLLGCFDVINSTTQTCYEAVEERLKIDKPNVFVIADYGVADGGTSMPLIYSLVERIKSICGEDQSVHVIYEDQPTNDFKSLFLRLQGLIPGPKSYFQDFTNTFVTACGTSFYQQCLPSNTIDFGFAASCMHYLQKKPCNITNGIHHTQITKDSERQLFADQGRIDWELILLQRAKEMKTGARFVVVQLCIAEDGQLLGQTKNIKHSMFGTLNEIVKSMVDSGKITQDEYDHINIVNYYRTKNEFSAPFLDENSPVVKAGLKLKSLDFKIIRCPYHTKWMKEKGDAKKHAKWYIPTIRAWSNSAFFSGLSERRTKEERNKIVDEIYNNYEAKVAANPSEHGMDYVDAFLVIEKI